MANDAAVAGVEPDLSRRKFLTQATAATGAAGAAIVAVPFVESWLPSERVRALGAPTELDVSKLEPGQMTMAIWRKKPIYVVRRTPEMLSKLPDHDGILKDPGSKESVQPDYAKNGTRSRVPEYLVLVGLCTHLGCLPKQHFTPGELGPSWPGGFFCPCHGSRFDLAGRVLAGSPASVNLVVPRYEFPNPRTLRVGLDEKGTA